MRAMFLTKSQESRISMIRNGDYDLLIHPKKMNRAGAAKIVVSYEDVTKDSVWLELNSRINQNTRVALECPSRYPKITSTKVQFLQKLCMKIGNVTIFDSMPFTLGIEYLYTPFSYMGRDILGFPHWYAFREGYSELSESGDIVNSLSSVALSQKIKPYVRCDYQSFAPKDASVIQHGYSNQELKGYQQVKSDSFQKHTTPSPIITSLADYANATKSRLECIEKVVLPGDAVFFNLASSATKAQKVLPKGAKAYSYAKPPSETPARVVIAEPSIANDYQQFDAEALSEKVLYIKGSAPVDNYLWGRVDMVRQQIDDLIKEVQK